VDHVERLLMAAIDELIGCQVGSDRLIQMALDALLDGVDTPALRQWLVSLEEPKAHDLFAQVIHELELVPSLPAHSVEARWELVRWWCQLVVDGGLSPEVGGRLIWMGWSELGTDVPMWGRPDSGRDVGGYHHQPPTHPPNGHRRVGATAR
jgi:hypothetical protein